MITMDNKTCSKTTNGESYATRWPGPPYAEDECLPPFQCRAMTKTSLASLYFPDVNATTAKQHLRRWIAYCKPLSDELRSIGYNPAKHSFSRNEVKVIVKHLGEP